MRADRLLAAHSLVASHQYHKAFAHVSSLLDEAPDNPELLFLAGAVLRGIGSPAMALPLLSKALSIRSDQPNLWMQYGAALHDVSKWGEAVEVFKQIGRMLPDDPMPQANIGAALTQMGKWREALEYTDRALSIEPDNHIAHISAGFANLGLGRWRKAWEHAEYLYGETLLIRIYTEKQEPQWDGSPGKTVVVTCDQGVGDIIMFSQCLHEMARDCKKVIVECDERMVPYFQRNFPEVAVYGTVKKQGITWPADHDIDARIHLSYLGRFYRNSDSDFPRKPYIKPHSSLVDKWRKWLADYPYPHIGIAWQGGIQRTQKHVRSIELADYAPLMNRAGTFIDLSYHDSSAEIAQWNIRLGKQVIRPPVNVANFDDTIALLAALTEVVTVTTTVAHVCGALGRSACVLVPDVPTWRYAYHCGDGMIWYPENSVRLFRRNAGEPDWSAAINRVMRHLDRTTLLAA